jgi:hypothetical protein
MMSKIVQREPCTAHIRVSCSPEPIMVTARLRQRRSMARRLQTSTKGSDASRDILVATRPLFSRSPFLPECHHRFGLPRPTTAPTAAAKRELSLANSMGQLDAGDRDGCVRERLEPSHRRTASLDRPMILLDDVVQIFAGPHFDVTPARMLSAQLLWRFPYRPGGTQ